MKRVLYITATLPALTVTFIYREIFRLRALDYRVSTVSMNTPEKNQVSEEARDLFQTTLFLDQRSILSKLGAFLVSCIRHPVRMSRCLLIGVSASPMQSARDYARLAYHLIEAAYLSRTTELEHIDRIHCHFINGPTSIGMFLGLLRNIPFSFTMHASMIWIDPIAFRNKLETCSFCVSISDYNRRYVLGEYGERFSSKIHVIHCGVDPGEEIEHAPGPAGKSELTILSVGQLTPRKGFHVLIPACEIVRASGLSFRCSIVGEGAQRPELEAAIADRALGDVVVLRGALPHEQISGCLAESDIFVLPCVISKDGWRDGIPVALMEAMLNRIPVISTDILGLPELIDDGVNGLLVPADDPAALAEAIQSLGRDGELRRSLGENARLKVLDQFNNEKSALALSELFDA